MSNYICKIPTIEELIKKQDYEIAHAVEDKDNWIVWKEKAIKRYKNKQIIPYYGFLDGKIICEATAAISKVGVENSFKLVDEKTAYLYAFRTIEEYQGKGYFSKLFKYMLEDLKNKGYEKVTIGVEPTELKNKKIYQKYGFIEHIKDAKEIYPNGEEVEVEYYGKYLK